MKRLCLLSLIALLGCQPSADAWIHGTSTIPFQGNPTVIITAIDTSGIGFLELTTVGAGGTTGTYPAFSSMVGVGLSGGAGTGAAARVIVNGLAPNGVSKFLYTPGGQGSGYHLNDMLSADAGVNGGGGGALAGSVLTVKALGIAMSRVSGSLPAFVHVSASSITATGTSRPYEDLDFTWNFGDSGGTEIITRPTDGASVNANTAQHGPEAAYVYRTTGPKIITLTIRGCAANIIVSNERVCTNTISATATATFTASAYTHSGGEFWVDSNYDSSQGAPNGTQLRPYTAIGDLKTVVATSNAAVHIAKGSQWLNQPNSSRLTVLGPLRIDTYQGIYSASTAKPVIQASAANTDFIFLLTATTDVVVSEMNFSSLPGSTSFTIQSILNNGENVMSPHDIYYDNITAQSSGGLVAGISYGGPCLGPGCLNNPNVPYNAGFWNCDFTGPDFEIGVGLKMDQFNFIIGGSITTIGNSGSLLDQSLYLDHNSHGLVRWLNFIGTGGHNFAINGDIDGYPETGIGFPHGFEATWLDISENNITGTNNGIDISTNASTGGDVTFQYVVIEGNYCHDYPLSQGNCIITNTMGKGTIRYNNMWNVFGAFFAIGMTSGAADTIFDPKIYGNNLYNSISTSGFFGGELSTSGRTSPLIFVNNILYSTSAAVHVLNPNDIATTIALPGTIFDTNKYYAPATTGGNQFVFVNGVGKTFIPVTGTWQLISPLLDPNSTNADPKWCSPSTGNFNICP